MLPERLTLSTALEKVFLLPQVGSKGFLVRKGDRSVTGLVRQQQCCGPTQIPVANVSVSADGYLDITGVASAIGEQPISVYATAVSSWRFSDGFHSGD
jgi:phosphoribosylformylglycinamidine synthase